MIRAYPINYNDCSQRLLINLTFERESHSMINRKCCEYRDDPSTIGSARGRRRGHANFRACWLSHPHESSYECGPPLPPAARELRVNHKKSWSFNLRLNYDCFHTTAKCVFWILIRNAHFELRSVHMIEVLAYFELRIIHTSDRKCHSPFESVEKRHGCVWVACQSNMHVCCLRFLCMCSAWYYRWKWLEGHTSSAPPKTRFWGQVIHTQISLRDLLES